MAEKNSFHLIVASVGETRFDGEAVSATFPGTAGEFTVLAHHQPFVTTLKKGTVHVKPQEGSAQDFSIEGGVLEVSSNRAIVLL